MSTMQEQNRQNIRKRLEEVHARPLATVKGPNKSTLDFWAADGQVYIIQEYANEEGFEIYKPTTDTNDWDTVLASIAPPKTRTFPFWGEVRAARIAAMMVEEGRWFQMEPCPDNEYRLTVKDENIDRVIKIVNL